MLNRKRFRTSNLRVHFLVFILLEYPWIGAS
jgi:hypothetical protein